MRQIEKVRSVLNILFLIGAIATFIIYFTYGKSPAFLYTGFTTLALKVFEFILRFVN